MIPDYQNRVQASPVACNCAVSVSHSFLVCGLASMVFVLSYAAAIAQEGVEAGKTNAAGDRYAWGLENPGGARETPAQGSAGITAEAYDKVVRDNIRLRQDNAEGLKSLEDSRKTNSDLAEKVKTLEETVRQQAASSAKKPAGGGTGADLATTLDENLTLREQKRSLDGEVARLKAEVGRLQASAAAGSSGPAVSEKSDLFKRLQQENTLLKQELQKLQQAEKQASEQGRTAAGANADARKTIQQLTEDNAQLRNAVDALRAQLREGGDTAVKLAAAREEIERKDKLVAEAARAIEAQIGERNRLAGLAREIAEFKKERSNLMFNLGALYAKVGMYIEAVEALRKVLEVQPDAADAHFNLGVIYDKHLSEPKKAEYHFKKFLELDPLSKDADKVKLWLLELEISR